VALIRSVGSPAGQGPDGGRAGAIRVRARPGYGAGSVDVVEAESRPALKQFADAGLIADGPTVDAHHAAGYADLNLA
jgi:hypothetical protein